MTPFGNIALFSIFILALFATALRGQITHPHSSPAEEALTLSPFEVRTDRDHGYTATSSLSGGRTDTPLKDTPSAVSVMTREFLDDIGASNFAEAAEWAVNSIPIGQTDTFNDFAVNMRGLGSSFPTRNHFRWFVVSDSYNIERLEFARGPNSILFGDGNVGGIATTWSKRAQFRNRLELGMRSDTYGGFRATIDGNVRAGDRLAVRTNGVRDRSKGWRDGEEPSGDRWHLALTVRMPARLELRGEVESGKYLKAIFAQNFTDVSSAWDRTTRYSGTTPPATAGTGVARLNSNANNDYLVWNPATPAAGVQNWKGFFRSTGTNLRLLPDPRPIANFPVLPSREFSLQPPESHVEAKYYTFSYYLTRSFGESLAFEVAYNRQHVERRAKNGVWASHAIDVNTVLPGGQPNPNFGRAYADVNPTHTLQENTTDDVRALGTYRFKTRWVKQRMTGIVGRRSEHFNAYGTRETRLGGINPSSQASTNFVFHRRYWDIGASLPGDKAPDIGGVKVGYSPTNVTDQDTTLTYAQVALNARFLRDRLSLVAGSRRDGFDRTQQTAVARAADGGPVLGGAAGPGILDTVDLSVATHSAGAVFFVVPSLGIYANYSETFNAPTIGDPLIDGTYPSPSSGKGIDAGFKLELFDGKISGSLNYYHTEDLGRLRGGPNRNDINEIWADLGRLDRQLADNYRDYESFRGEGFELDITANPTKNWRLLFNVARPQTRQQNIGPGLRAYYAAHQDEWRAGAPTSADPTRVAQNIADIERTLQGFTEGRVRNGTAKHTANFYSTYAFREGRLKGFSAGGGVNLRGKMVIGNVNGRPFDYVYAASYYLLSANAAYRFKVGRSGVRLQVNVYNLLDRDDLIFTGYSFNQVLGQDVPNTFRYTDPRRFALSATVTF